ncbi:LOW QUALITY PROTEIN: Uncharacterized protein PHPALM_27926 [Phytophthora palmivora]|uniref:Uncharacterized protein n=1 Tax=Phytophthora palmivora TaxID=4796 RepID=A0A2P4XBF3_9STRA|nr:LOW QUALITY PROTEIN: Uncharacterized protein PHPALM_27926 [Phytophthora palmivora]
MASREDKLLRWHMRFANQNVEAMKTMVRKNMGEGMESLTLNDFNGRFRCIVCQCAKQKRRSYKRQQGKRQKESNARLSSDVCHVGVLTPGGNIYCQLVQDEASRYKWCFQLKDKSETIQNVMDLILQLEKEHSIKIFSSDQGKEFVNKALKKFLKAHLIKTSEENCLVEKLNGGLMGKGEVLGYVIEVDNMSATKALNWITPHEKLFKQPHVSDLHVCGSIVFHYVPKKKRKNKLNMKADPGIFLGYAKDSLGYRILDLGTGNLVKRRDVVFHEDLTADPKYGKDLINKRYCGKIMSSPTSIDLYPCPSVVCIFH